MAILDADKEGFLRSETSLIQTIGRAARNANSKVILYADKVTQAMRAAIDETERRRGLQMEYNTKHGIIPKTVRSKIKKGIDAESAKRQQANSRVQGVQDTQLITMEMLDKLEQEMLAAAEELQFEKVAMK